MTRALFAPYIRCVSDVAAAIAISLARKVPYSERKALIDFFGSASGVYRAAREEENSSEEVVRAKRVRSFSDFSRAEKEFEKVKKEKGWILAYGSLEYPRWLAEIPDPPLALFGKGNLPSADSLHLGFVGPRRPSPYGARIARMLAEDLVREGVILVSGLALGIDAIAHEAAVKAKVPTIAVLGCGIDQIYPPEHSHLKSQIEANGAVVSEFVCGEPARTEHFPRRNRIITGLSRGVLVVEAGERSGARITARHAVEQSREVFAVPGPIDSPLSFWPNRLISDGAKLVSSSADILQTFIPGYGIEARPRIEPRSVPSTLSTGAQKMLEHLSYDLPATVDELVRRGEAPISNVLMWLMELEMSGVISKQSDARYLRV